MAGKITQNPTNAQLLAEIKSVRGMVANQTKKLNQHEADILELKEHNKNEAIAKKAAQDAVAAYKKSEEELARKTPDNKWLTKELLSVIIKLIAVIAALIAVWKVGVSGQ